MMNSNGYSLADISAATGYNHGNDSAWGNGAWLWVILIFAIFGGWGNGFGGWGGNGSGQLQGYATQADIQRGFDNQSVMNKLNALENGLCSLGYDQLAQMNSINQNASQTGYAVQNAIQQASDNATRNAFNIQQAINADTVSNLTNTNNLSTQLSNCCCETREAIMGVNYNTATQTAALQNTLNTNARDIIENQNAGVKSILDYLCQDKISTLQAENQSLRLAASQSNQNAILQAAMDANTAEILRRTAPLPVPSYQVANPYTGQYGYYNYGCGSCA